MGDGFDLGTRICILTAKRRERGNKCIAVCMFLSLVVVVGCKQFDRLAGRAIALKILNFWMLGF